jgi:hypothetical protein
MLFLMSENCVFGFLHCRPAGMDLLREVKLCVPQDRFKLGGFQLQVLLRGLLVGIFQSVQFYAKHWRRSHNELLCN